MAEVVYHYGAQVNNNKILGPVLRSFTIFFNAINNFEVVYYYGAQINNSQIPGPRLQSFTVFTDASYYNIVCSNINYVCDMEQFQTSIMYTIYNLRYKSVIQSFILNMSILNSTELSINTSMPISNSIGLNVSGCVPKGYSINTEILNRHIKIVDTSSNYIVHSFKQNYVNNDFTTGYITCSQSGNNITNTQISLSQSNIVQYIGHVVQSQFGTLKKSIFDYSSLGSTLLTLGFGYKFNFVNVFTRSEIHHVYNLHPEYILRNVDYRRLISSTHSPGITVGDMYTVQTYLWTTYLRVHTSVDIPVDDVSFDIYTQYTVADVSAGSSTISVPYTIFYDIGDSIIITDGTNYYERTITDVTDTAIILDTPISQDIVNARIYKKAKMNRAYILYETYTPTLDHYILIKGSHDCTLSVSTPTTFMNVDITAGTYKEIQLTYFTESIVMPETAQNRIIVKFGSVTQDYIVQFIKLKAEPLIRPTNTSAIERAVSWFNNMFSDEIEILYDLLRGASHNIEKQAVNKLIYYAPFTEISIEDINLYNINILPGSETFIVRSAIVYLSNTLYTVLVESVSTNNDVILSIHKQPDRLHVFAKGSDIYVYIPITWNGTLNRIDLQVYYI